MKAKISIKFYSSKVLSDYTSPIMISICKDGKRKYVSTGISCLPSDWDNKKNELKKSVKNAKAMNLIIQQKYSSIISRELELIAQNIPYNIDDLIASVKTNSSNKLLLSDLLKQYIEHKKSKHSTVVNYEYALSILNEHNVRYVNQVNTDVIDGIIYGKLKDNSSRNVIKNIKSLLNFAAKNKIIKENPIKGYKSDKKMNFETKKRALSYEDISRIEYNYITKYFITNEQIDSIKQMNQEQINSIKDKELREYYTNIINGKINIYSEAFSVGLFLLSYNMQGLALVDLLTLKKSDFQIYNYSDKSALQNNLLNPQSKQYFRVETQRNKTGKNVTIFIPIDQFMMLTNIIFNQHFNPDSIENDDYFFPVFNKKMSEIEVFKKKQILQVMLNRKLKSFAKKVGINDDITFYTARHSFASVLNWNNVNPSLIAQMMGRDVTDIQVYLKQFNDNQIIESLQYINRIKK